MISMHRTNTENEKVFDERRQQMLNSRSMNHQQQQIHQRQFRNFRPDLNMFDEHSFQQKLYVAENYLDFMRQKVNKEFHRMCLQTPPAFRSYKIEKFEKTILQLSQPFTRASRVGTNRNWQEACVLVNYVDLVYNKVQKYGLEYPMLDDKMNYQQCQQKEQEVAELMFQEMLKQPYVQSQ